jgi:hypothetical protein
MITKHQLAYLRGQAHAREHFEDEGLAFVMKKAVRMHGVDVIVDEFRNRDAPGFADFVNPDILDDYVAGYSQVVSELLTQWNKS